MHKIKLKYSQNDFTNFTNLLFQWNFLTNLSLLSTGNQGVNIINYAKARERIKQFKEEKK